MSMQPLQVLSGQSADDIAATLHADASAKTYHHLDLFVGLNTGFEQWPQAIGGPLVNQQADKNASIKQFPDLEKLFGAQSFCECEHCRSVYGPAAYLVDLLHIFLDDTTLDDPTTPPANVAPPPIAELLKRRPDLVSITLSCENTNTPLPYVDLVNEALESFITLHLDANDEWADSAVGAKFEVHDTGATPADELRAVPQYVKSGVYRHLASKAVFPMTLPFDRSLAVARIYLEHLGTSLAELMERFQSPWGIGANVVQPTAHDIAIEVLGLSSTQAKIVDGSLGKNVWEYYGLQTEPELPGLNAVSELLQRTGLDLNDLLALLKTRFVNPLINEPDDSTGPQPIRIQYPAWPNDACDVTKMKFVNLHASSLDRMHRFVRLWRVLGGTMADLDRALTALGGELSGETLEKLAGIKQVALGLKRPIAELLVLWADIDTWGEDSLYARLFLSPALISEADAQAAFAAIHAGGSLSLDTKLAAAVAAALAVTPDDLDRIRSHLDPSGPTASAKLDLASLSALCRYAALAKALRIRVRDLITLLSLVPADANPFVASNPGPAIRFVQFARNVLESRFSIPLINYLFRGEIEPTRHPAPTRATIEGTLTGLQKGLAALQQETVVPGEPTADDLRSALDLAKKFLGEKDANGELVKQLSPDEAIAMLDPRVTELEGKPIALADRKTFVNKHFGEFLSQADQSLLFDGSFASNASEERFLKNVSVVLNALLPWLRVKEQELLITRTLADAVGVDEKVANAMLAGKVDGKYLLHSIDDSQHSALKDFLSLIDQSGGVVPFEVDDASTAPVATFVRLFKSAAYVAAFGMTESELRLFASSSTPAIIPNLKPARLDFDLLPLALVAATDLQPRRHFELWQQVAKYYRLRAALPKSEKTLPDFFAPLDLNVTPDVRIKTLVEVTGWEQTLVEPLLTGFKIQITELTDVDRLFDFHRAVQLAKRLGASLKQKEGDETQLQEHNVFEWAATPTGPEQADAIVQMVKARYERAQWLEIARRLNDPIRERQRDAMVALLLVRLGPKIPVVQFPHPLLTSGAKGAAVKELQQKLNAAQTSATLVVDGKFGPKTFAAVKQFQTTHGLSADGKVGPLTWAALDAAVSVRWTANELLEYFLIDVEMSSCMLTSRIKQAISSVQLFIHRCLLNLEPAVSPAEIDVEQWEWMKNYRVWEANRKVFLYPENWIEPELRDDKTPFFRELETELLQNEITDETVEKALINYLYKLDEVARLDIRGFCREIIPETPKSDETQREVYHVFGRTWNPPYVYYYRKGTFELESDAAGGWTPWERIELDIEGDHLIPAMHNRRLYLFWLSFEEAPGKTAQSGQEPAPTWKIRIKWVERLDAKWGPKSVSAEYIGDPIIVDQTFSDPLKAVAHNRAFRRGRVTSHGDRLAIEVCREPLGGDNVEDWVPKSEFSGPDGLQELAGAGGFELRECKGLLTQTDSVQQLRFFASPSARVRAQTLECGGNKLDFPALHQEPVLAKLQVSLRSWPALLPLATLDEQSSKQWFPFYLNHAPDVFFARPVSAKIFEEMAASKPGDIFAEPPILKKKPDPVAELLAVNVGQVSLAQGTGGSEGNHV